MNKYKLTCKIHYLEDLLLRSKNIQEQLQIRERLQKLRMTYQNMERAQA